VLTTTDSAHRHQVVNTRDYGGKSTVAAIFSIVVSSFAVLVSIAFGWTSRKIAQRGLRQVGLQSSTELMLSVDRIFIEHADIRPYFYNNCAVPAGVGIGEKGNDRNLVLAVAEFVLDVLECIWDHNDDNKVTADRTAWKQYILDVFTTSPALRELYAEYQPPDAGDEGWYPTLARLMKEAGRGAEAELNSGA
jgi:hypothetical protein